MLCWKARSPERQGAPCKDRKVDLARFQNLLLSDEVYITAICESGFRAHYELHTIKLERYREYGASCVSTLLC